MTSLAGPLTALQSVRSNALVAMVLQLLASALPGGLALDRTITQFGDQATGVAAVVRLIGALMSTEALTREVSTTAQTIAGMLDSAGADGALAQLTTAANASLVDLINAASPDDPDQVAAVVPPVAAFADAIRGASNRLLSGMAFGEATLVGADIQTVADGVTQAAQLLNEAALGPVRSLAMEVAGWSTSSSGSISARLPHRSTRSSAS